VEKHERNLFKRQTPNISMLSSISLTIAWLLFQLFGGSVLPFISEHYLFGTALLIIIIGLFTLGVLVTFYTGVYAIVKLATGNKGEIWKPIISLLLLMWTLYMVVFR
jgi:hypothetical protein